MKSRKIRKRGLPLRYRGNVIGKKVIINLLDKYKLIDIGIPTEEAEFFANKKVEAVIHTNVWQEIYYFFSNSIKWENKYNKKQDWYVFPNYCVVLKTINES